MDTLTFQYRFIFPDHIEDFEVILDARKIELKNPPPGPFPEWANLDYYQCPNCPLTVRETPHCPLAANVFHIVTRFAQAMSYHQTRLEVITAERVISKDTTLQRALSSLMGLLIATSQCPHAFFFKPMARFHLPLASEQEMVYRMASMYMLAQYFRKKSGMEPDLNLKGLEKICRDIEVVNSAVSKRLRAAGSSDSAVNAIILLDVFAKSMPWAIEESLETVRHLFEPYNACFWSA